MTANLSALNLDRHSSSANEEVFPRAETLEEEASTPTYFQAFRSAGRYFVKEEREKMLTAIKAVAGLVKTALIQAGGAGGGAQATGELGNIASIGLGCWGIVSVPFKILSTFDALDKMIEIFSNPEAGTTEKVAAVAKLLFKELAGLGKALCSGVIFISQYVVRIAPVGAISALGIAGGALGIVGAFYELVGSAIMLYEMIIGKREVTGLSGAVLALKSIAAFAGLTLAVITLVVLLGGAVFNPWVLPALVAFAIFTSIIYVIVEKVYEYREASKKEALLD